MFSQAVVGVDGYQGGSDAIAIATSLITIEDLLIVGSRGCGTSGRLVHGSASRRLARSARRPLLVPPLGARLIEGQGSEGGIADVAAAASS